MSKRPQRHQAKRSRGRRPTAKRATPPQATAEPPEAIFTEDGERAHDPGADDFAAHVSVSDAARAIEVRAGFTTALMGDPRVECLFQSWFGRLFAFDDAAKAGQAPEDPNFDDVLPFVQTELGLAGPWCTIAILETFNRMVAQRTVDPTSALPTPGVADILAPPFLVGFSTEIFAAPARGE